LALRIGVAPLELQQREWGDVRQQAPHRWSQLKLRGGGCV
jgi:hypothetical protein